MPGNFTDGSMCFWVCSSEWVSMSFIGKEQTYMAAPWGAQFWSYAKSANRNICKWCVFLRSTRILGLHQQVHTQHPHSPEHGHTDTAVKLWLREVTRRSRDHGGVHEGLGWSVLAGRHRFPRLQLDLALQVLQVFIYLLPSAASGRTGSRGWKTDVPPLELQVYSIPPWQGIKHQLHD